MKGSLHISGQGSPIRMDYKGYNIAVHELGHNIEQTITLYDVDNYMMTGVPNTAVTEAMAYVFQVRDLKLLGMKMIILKGENGNTGCRLAAYGIMGVGMVEMNFWKWMYQNPRRHRPAERSHIEHRTRDVE